MFFFIIYLFVGYLTAYIILSTASEVKRGENQPTTGRGRIPGERAANVYAQCGLSSNATTLTETRRRTSPRKRKGQLSNGNMYTFIGYF